MLVSFCHAALLLAIANAAPQIAGGSLVGPDVSAANELEGRQVQVYICKSLQRICSVSGHHHRTYHTDKSLLLVGNSGEVGVGN